MRSPDAMKMRATTPVQVIAVTGGKGGVGKTSVSVHLATALAAAGRRVMLFDGDLGLANVDVFLGLSPKYTMAHVIAGERSLEEVIVDAPQGFRVVPGASGVAALASLGAREHLGLVQGFSALAMRLDALIVDTPAGLAHGVLQFSQAARQVLVVVCDEPASMTDAYALVKVLSRSHGVRRFRVLANRVRQRGAGATLYRTLERVTARFLDVVLEYAGEIPDDPCMLRAIRAQRTVFDAWPSSPSALAFKNLAAAVDKWPIPEAPRGNVEFFVERLVARREATLRVVR